MKAIIYLVLSGLTFLNVGYAEVLFSSRPCLNTEACIEIGYSTYGKCYPTAYLRKYASGSESPYPIIVNSTKVPIFLGQALSNYANYSGKFDSDGLLRENGNLFSTDILTDCQESDSFGVL